MPARSGGNRRKLAETLFAGARHWSGALIGANFDDIPGNNLILRRPRSGRLEGWATHEIVEKAGSQQLLCCPPFETRPCGPLLRVRLVCKLAPMSAGLQARSCHCTTTKMRRSALRQ